MTENFELCPIMTACFGVHRKCESLCAWRVAGRYVDRCALAVLAEELVERRIEEDDNEEDH